MKRFRLTSSHAEDIGGGRLPEPGQEFTADPEDPTINRLVTEGKAVELPEPTGATPAAEAKAKELGVNLDSVEGTGKDNRITVEDVENASDAGDENDSEED